MSELKFPDANISRRRTLKIIGGALAAGIADFGLIPRLFGAGRGLDLGKRPNMVFILSDDHRADTMGNAGHPFIKTPSLDRLAKEGIKFTNTFAATPLCSPSRGCFLTGQYAHRHGVKNNFTPWNDNNVTFLELLKKAGYKNAFFGKWHMPGRLPDLLGKAVDRFVTFTASGGQGLYFDCPLIIDGVVTQRKGKYLTEDLTDLALDFIRKEKDGPFCVYLAHKAPHQPFLPPPELKSLYRDADVRRTLPPEYHSFIHRKEGSGYYGLLGSVGEKYLDYHRVITAMDQQIGRILSELDRLGLTENTIVVYTSDNGYFWGEKQLIDKRFPYEEATRIPLIVRYPAKIKNPGSTSSEMTLSIDLAPTLLDLAGVPIPEIMRGRSFVPILKGDSNLSPRFAVHLEHFKDFPYSVPEWDAVRTERYLYVEYKSKKSPELFNIQKDPRTLYNLIQTPEGKRVLPELQKTMLGYLRKKGDG
jgi:N-acetylglucosamine-6-sulfatase